MYYCSPDFPDIFTHDNSEQEPIGPFSNPQLNAHWRRVCQEEEEERKIIEAVKQAQKQAKIKKEKQGQNAV